MAAVPSCGEQTELRPGGTVEGTLEDGDARFDGALIDYYALRIADPGPLVLTLTSADFDPLLLTFDAAGDVVHQAFDSIGAPPGSAESATLTVSFAAGCTLVGASAWTAGDAGDYGLTAVRAGVP